MQLQSRLKMANLISMYWQWSRFKSSVLFP
ncbi:hypothetical protein F383_14306 [Gossypium arboreum]|uniref:Uncharacterized protein n=2 Tax=Gossypium arboreum TaxID=29729 RepID=A0A0B0NHH1_GOSAR|nr:hypothetical protein F383_14306 [Gossypium arboreum]